MSQETVTGSDFVSPTRFENYIKIGTATGGNDESPVMFVNTRGLWIKRSGSSGLSEGYDKMINSYDMYCYWRNHIESFINKDTKLIYDNRQYSIVTYERIGERRQYFHFEVVEFH